jgi:hypothetical protein
VGQHALTVEQLRAAAEAGWDIRWQLLWDMNHDGAVSVSDVWPLVAYFFFAPGDFFLFLLMLHATSVAIFLGIDLQSISGFLSGFISTVIWLAVLYFSANRTAF